MAKSRYGGITGEIPIREDFENINKALLNVEAESDQRKATLDSHTNNTNVHVTTADKTNWNSKASGTELATHMADDERHLTAADRDRLDNAAANVKAFSQVNDVVAKGPDSKLNIKAGPGIIITTNPATGDVTVTGDGGGVPDKHGTSHNIGGADEIPDLSRAVTEAEEAKEAAAEAKASATEALTLAQQMESKIVTHADSKIYNSEAHGLRVQNNKLQFIKPDGTWQSTGNDIILSDSITGNRSNVAASELAVNKVANRPYTDTTFISGVTYLVPRIQNLPRDTYVNLQFVANVDTLGELSDNGVRLKNPGVYNVCLYGYISKNSGSLAKGSEFLLALQYNSHDSRNRNDFIASVYNDAQDRSSVILAGSGLVYIGGVTDVKITARTTDTNTYFSGGELIVTRIR